MRPVCAICGVREATTRDHVPPKGIFIKPRPSNLVTVPACTKCNNHSSRLDERFLVNLGLHVSSAGSKGARVFNERVVPTLKHNRKLLNKIVKRTRPVEITTPQGIGYERLYIGEWDHEAHDKIIERTVRGLYYHHFEEVLGRESTVKTHYFRTLSDDLYNASKRWAVNILGKNDVVYRYAMAEGPKHKASVWLFQFYGAHWAGAQTMTPIVEGNAS